MPSRSIEWDLKTSPGCHRDIHVMRGFPSRELLDDLVFRDENGDETPVEEDQVVFHPLFKATLNGDWLENADIGIKVNVKTGAVDADPPQADPFPKVKNNFIIEIKGVDPAFTTSNTQIIRAHVHINAADAWLTPDHLTVRPADANPPTDSVLTSYRFTVHALFDTGMVGDITLHHGVVFSPEKNVAVHTGHLRFAPGDVPDKDIEIRATLPASMGGRVTPPAVFRMRSPWASVPDKPRASIVVGSVYPGETWDGTQFPDRVPNVLVVGDGLRDIQTDRDAFNQVVDKIVHHLKTDQLERPFDLLSTRMNFWRLLAPSGELGLSVRSEVFHFEEDGKDWAAAMPVVQKPPANDPWKIEHLLYAVGLPVAGDLFDENGDEKTPDVLRDEWKEVVDTDLSKVPQKVIKNWTLIHERGFIDQLDAFPGMSYGTPPAASDTDNVLLGLHEDRGGIDALRLFLATVSAAPDANGTVTTGTGKPIGDLWVTKDPAYDFDNRHLVLLISGMEGGRSVNTSFIAMTTNSGNVQIPVKTMTAPPRAEWKLDLPAAPEKISTDSCRTAAHELAHSFGLLDEYAEFDGAYPHAESDLDGYANVQTESDAQVEVTEAGNTMRVLHGDQIKWNWHRIHKAAVITGSIEQAGEVFRVPLVARQGLQFKTGDKVMLRLRAAGVPIKKGQRTFGDKTVGHELEIADPPEITQLVLPGDDEAWQKGDIRYIKPVAGNTAAIADVKDFQRGCILYMPTPAVESVPAGHPYAEMVAWNIKDYITTKRRPLTKVPTEEPCKVDSSPTVRPVLHGVTIRAVWTYKIVGLYVGGALWACGIFHPTGSCVMNDHSDESTYFCAVCRYIMVDLIDPFRHFEIDRDYERDYPQPIPGDSNEIP